MRWKRMLWSTAVAMSFNPLAQADEGMWMPSQLPSIGQQLKAAGYRGNPAALADLTRAPLSAYETVLVDTPASFATSALVATEPTPYDCSAPAAPAWAIH